MVRFKPFAEVKADYLDSSPEARMLWETTGERRALGLMLADMRSRNALSQAELAEATGWDKGYVSRLEGATDGFPTIKTLARYAAACGEGLGLVTYAAAQNDQTLTFSGFLPIALEESARSSATGDDTGRPSMAEPTAATKFHG